MTNCEALETELREARDTIARLNLSLDDVLVREMLVRRVSRRLSKAAATVRSLRAEVVGSVITHAGLERTFTALEEATDTLLDQADALERALKPTTDVLHG